MNTNVLLGNVSMRLIPSLRRGIILQLALCLLCVILLTLGDAKGLTAFLLISSGALLATWNWAYRGGCGIPVMPMIAVQTLVVYGLPTVFGSDAVMRYTREEVTRGGVEVLIFLLAMCLVWNLVVRARMHSPQSYFAFRFLDRTEQLRRLYITGFGCVLTDVLFLGLFYWDPLLALFGSLPSGTFPVVRTFAATASTLGCLILGFCAGARPHNNTYKWSLISCLTVHTLMSCASLLLIGSARPLAAAAFGLFLGSARVPLKFIALTLVGLTFLNSGKLEMRERYWEGGSQHLRSVDVFTLPRFYLEWSECSFGTILGGKRSDGKGSLSLTRRIDSLQNILFVQRATQQGRELLQGETYSPIFLAPLVIPRIFWHDKPSTHSGQFRLNLHFRRQESIEETSTTYIAWGPMAEAYGNFGSIYGALFMGAFMGAFAGWIENRSKYYPIGSLEAALALVLTLQLAVSFGMVASTWISSTAQTLFCVTVAASTQVQKRRITALNRAPSSRPRSK